MITNAERRMKIVNVSRMLDEEASIRFNASACVLMMVFKSD